MSELPPELAPGETLPENVLRLHLRSCGRGIRVYKGCRLVPPERISIGDFTQIDEGTFLFAGEGIKIGRHTHLAFGASISGGGQCTIGDFVGISTGCRIVTGTESIEGGLTNPTIPGHLRSVVRGLVTIEAHALVFAQATVLPGVTIGEGAVVGAGAVVHHNLKPWAIYAGFPLVQIGTRDREPILEAARLLQSSHLE